MPTQTYLDEILNARRARLDHSMRERSVDSVREAAHYSRQRATPHNFYRAVSPHPGVNLIAEFKRASPSRGEINLNASAGETARLYQAGGAAAISVLTEEQFFRGSLDDLIDVKRSCSLPVLRKDFICHPFQIYEAAEAGADAVLLIAAALTNEELVNLRQVAEDELAVDALVEVHSRDEMKRAAEAGATLIGVNNRDLRTFMVSLDVSLELAPLAPSGAVLVSESGIKDAADIERLSEIGYRAFLVGETLMRAERPDVELRSLVGSRA
jgi:indole-3-glycerol phosphate synthase